MKPGATLHFTKMHGLGNDFMMVDGITQPVRLSTEQIRRLADRHFGVGFDQLLLVEPPDRPDVDFRYRIFNADGGEVAQCGNGARCFARFVRDQKLTRKRVIRVQTGAGVMELQVTRDGWVRVEMGEPAFEPAAIPLRMPERQSVYQLQALGRSWELGAVSLGNPHGVLEVSDLADAPVETLGPLLEAHESFPERANIGFMQVISADAIRLRVYERGAGETLACGSGACAAVVVGRLWGRLNERVTVTLPGGDLVVEWRGEGAPVIMEGPTARVFEGDIRLGGKRRRPNRRNRRGK